MLAAGPGHSLLACWPRTGRTHQIRVHMSYIGHPLAGDTLYGGSDILLRRHALHCGILAFAHPLTGEPLRVECPLPEDMACLLYTSPSSPPAPRRRSRRTRTPSRGSISGPCWSAPRSCNHRNNTNGLLKFSALRREVRVQNEDGSVSALSLIHI